MELRHDDALGTIDDERALGSHVRDGSEIYVLHNRIEILVVGVGAVKFKFCFERNAIGKSALKTLLDRVAGRINIIVEKLEHEIVARVGDGEIFCEHFVKSLILSLFRGSVEL